MSARKKDNLIEFDEVEIEPDMPVFTTGVVCTILDIPIWILKQLDNEGIVSPPREANTHSRLYSKRELKKVKRCWFYMKRHNVKVGGLKVILRIEEGTFTIE